MVGDSVNTDVRQLDAVEGILERAKKHGAVSIKVTVGELSVEAVLAPLPEQRKPGQERADAEELRDWSS
jgi:hypothetical protein